MMPGVRPAKILVLAAASALVLPAASALVLPAASALVLAAASALVLPAAAEAAAKAPACRDIAGLTVYQDPQLRVYTTSRNVKGDPDAHTLRVFACTPSKRVTHQLELLHNNLDGQLNPVRVTRGGTRWIVIDFAEETGTAAAHDLWEYDVARFRRAGRTGVEGAEDPGVVVTRDGGFAFFDGLKLEAVDSVSRRVLEPAPSAPGAGATALAAGGDSVYWQAGGAGRSAPLSGHPSGDIAAPSGP
jgi:hypothetical protein